MTCSDCDAPDDQGCRVGCPSIVRDVLRTGVRNELCAVQKELEACHEVVRGYESGCGAGYRDGLATALRCITTRIPL